MSDCFAIEFAAEGEAAKINYSIPMPGAHTGRRVMKVALDLKKDRPYTPGALTVWHPERVPDSDGCCIRTSS